MLHKSLSVQLIILANQIRQRKYVRPIRGYRKKKTMKKPVGSGWIYEKAEETWEQAMISSSLT